MRLTAVREEGLFGEENYPETGSDSEQERPTTGTRWKDAAKSPGSVRSKSAPPRGMNLSKDALEALGTGKGEKMMEGLDKDIASCKRLVQNNKQLLFGLRRKTREVSECVARTFLPSPPSWVRRQLDMLRLSLILTSRSSSWRLFIRSGFRSVKMTSEVEILIIVLYAK